MRSSSDLSVESAIRSEGLGWSARSGFSVNAGALFPASVPAGSYALRVCADVCSGRTHRGNVQARLEASVKGPRPTRFTTLSCNYHHKVDFTSSKSPRKGMLHFADPSPRPRAPFSATLGLRGTYGETTLASSRPLSATPSPFDQHAPSFPFRATLPFDRIGNVKTCRGLPFTPPRIPEIADQESISCSWRLRDPRRGRGNLFDLG